MVHRKSKIALEIQSPYTFLLNHPQKIGSLLVTKQLLHLQALRPSYRKEEGKKQRAKGTCQFYQESDDHSLDCDLQVIGQNYVTSQW